jgi:hypothetical protein
MDDYFLLDSWFDVGAEVDALLMSDHAPRRNREVLITEKVLESRREWWAQLAAWSAFILYQAGSEEGWQEKDGQLACTSRTQLYLWGPSSVALVIETVNLTRRELRCGGAFCYHSSSGVGCR